MADTKLSALTAKAIPVAADIVHILDSAASNADKRTTVGALLVGASGWVAATVQAYGVDPTGATNNATELQAALTAAAGKVLLIPPGSYRVQTKLTTPSNITVLAYGAKFLRYDSNLGTADGAGNPTLQIPNGITNVKIFGLEIDGRNASWSSSQWGHGIGINGGSHVHIEDCVLHNNPGDGILLGSDNPGVVFNKYVSLVNIYSYANDRLGGTVTDGEVVNVVNCRFQGQTGESPMSGFDIEPDQDDAVIEHITFTNCDFTANGNAVDDGAGLTVSLQPAAARQRGITFKDCRIRANTIMGVIVYIGTDVLFDGCEFYANGNNSLWLRRTITNLRVTNCTFRANASHAIKIGDTGYTITDVLIQGNRIVGSADSGDGVYFQDATITNVTIRDNYMTGVRYGVNTLSDADGTYSRVHVYNNDITGSSGVANLGDDIATRLLRDNRGLADYPVATNVADGSPHPGWAIGSLHDPLMGQRNTATTITADMLLGTLIFVPGAYTIDQVGLRVTTGAAGGKVMWLAVYAVGADGLPAARLAVSGSLAADGAAADKTATISLVTTGPTWLFVAMHSDGTPQFHGTTVGSHPYFGAGAISSTSTGIGYASQGAGGAGTSAPPDPFPAVTLSVQSKAPTIFLRRSA